jgi:hypothetical protein
MSETPPPCDNQVYKKGTPVFLLAGVPAVDIEEWVKMIAEKSGQRVDWHFIAGRANVKCLGDADKVVQTIEENIDEIANKTDYWQYTYGT